MGAVIRKADPDEVSALGYASYGDEQHAWVLERDGAILGRCAATVDRGAVFAYGMSVASDDQFDALRLWKRVKRDLKALGYQQVYLHITKADDPRVREMWNRIGFEEVMVILRGEL